MLPFIFGPLQNKCLDAAKHEFGNAAFVHLMFETFRKLVWILANIDWVQQESHPIPDELHPPVVRYWVQIASATHGFSLHLINAESTSCYVWMPRSWGCRVFLCSLWWSSADQQLLASFFFLKLVEIGIGQNHSVVVGVHVYVWFFFFFSVVSTDATGSWPAVVYCHWWQ